LFDDPFVDGRAALPFLGPTEEERRLGRELAGRSLVLVENAGILPLPAALRSVAVIGPLADSSRELLGDYSYAAALETLLDPTDYPAPPPRLEQGESILRAELAGRRTILDALRDRLAGADVRYEAGCGLTDGTSAAIAAAAETARGADVAILVLGERSGLSASCSRRLWQPIRPSCSSS
jgi:beta-glucosidase